MTYQGRIAYDVSLPVVAAQAFNACDHDFVPGDPVNWRALGIAETMLYNWWRGGLIAFQPEPARDAAAKPKRKAG